MNKLLFFSLSVVDCGLLAPPVNGSIMISETTFESLSTFTCGSGFNLFGSSFRQCQANGEWSGTNTTCESNKLLFIIHVS